MQIYDATLNYTNYTTLHDLNYTTLQWLHYTTLITVHYTNKTTTTTTITTTTTTATLTTTLITLHSDTPLIALHFTTLQQLQLQLQVQLQLHYSTQHYTTQISPLLLGGWCWSTHLAVAPAFFSTKCRTWVYKMGCLETRCPGPG